MPRIIDICYVLLLFVMQALIVSCYEMNDDSARGLRVASNNQVAVYARNSESVYLVHYAVYKYSPTATATYPNTNFFIYSLDVVKTEIETGAFVKNFTFVQVGALPGDYSSIVLSVVRVTINENETFTMNFTDTYIYNGSSQAYMDLKIDPRGQYAYIFADSFTLSFDIFQNKIVDYLLTSDFPPDGQYLPRAFDLTDAGAIVAGLTRYQTHLHMAIYLVQLQPLVNLGSIYPVTREMIYDGLYTDTYDRANDMSVSFNPSKDRASIGIPMYDRLYIFAINISSFDSSEWSTNLINDTIWSITGIGFGRSVAWIDSKTIVVCVLSLPGRYWSQSELWICNVDETFDKPLFVFPNGQQNIRPNKPRLTFLQIVVSTTFMYIVTDQKHLIIYANSPPGFASAINDLYYKPRANILTPQNCVSGTYKNTSGFGPCVVCPPETMNPADDTSTSNTECQPCAPTYFCSLGSTDNMSLDALPSYTQSFSYPDTPDINNYDDLLFQNMFTIPKISGCIVYIPMFWSLLVIGLCFLVWLIMKLLKLRRFQITRPYRSRTKLILKQIDIINEEERWIGGLFSLAAIVLISFSFWFAASYISTYPIETAHSLYTTCQTGVYNTEFSNALQLPLPSVNGQYWPIFGMLDNQPMKLTVDLINTGASCSNITVQQNRPSVKYLLLPIESCSYHDSSNATLSVTFSLPSHSSTVQLNITGPYFVGGIRLCLHGPGLVQGVNTLHYLDTCQFYFTENETIGHDVTVPIALIKMINQTKPLSIGGKTLYDGRWAPTWNTANGLSDKLVYEQNGDYLRYTYYQNFVTVTLIEQPFFVQNSQQPIIRTAELAFHTLLFTSLVIELFGFGFLLVKMIIIPLFTPVVRFFHHVKQHSVAKIAK